MPNCLRPLALAATFVRAVNASLGYLAFMSFCFLIPAYLKLNENLVYAVRHSKPTLFGGRKETLHLFLADSP